MRHLTKTKTSQLGRLPVHDLEAAQGHRERLVDLRTLQYIVFKNTRYEVK